MGQHDLSYRSLFSFPRMVRELVCEFVDEPWVEKLDFTTLQRVNVSLVAAEQLKGREGDLLWKLRLSDGNGKAKWWAPEELAELIERVDGAAAEYVPRLRFLVIDESRYPLEDLERRASVAAQIFWLEQSRERKDLGPGARRLVDLLSDPEDGPLRRAVLVWFAYVLLPRHGEVEPIPEALGLEEFKVMLEKRVEEWNHEILEEGRLLGLKEGRKEGEAALLLRLLERKFGRLDLQTRERVQGADAERLLDWGERVLTAERLEDVFDN